MKISILLFFTLLSLSSFAEQISYTIGEGKLHKGGQAWVEATAGDAYVVKVKYEITKKRWAPVPSDVLKGEDEFLLPIHFQDERGYLELEAAGTINVSDVTIKFIKRSDYGDFKNAYEIHVIPKNGRSLIEVIYHPEVPAAGWGRIKVTFISKVPLLNGYEIEMNHNR